MASHGAPSDRLGTTHAASAICLPAARRPPSGNAAPSRDAMARRGHSARKSRRSVRCCRRVRYAIAMFGRRSGHRRQLCCALDSASGLTVETCAGDESRCGAEALDEDARHEPRGTVDRYDGRPARRRRAATRRVGPPVQRGRSREDLALTFPTYLRHWAIGRRQRRPMLSETFGHRLPSTGDSAKPLKGTRATASRAVRGTLWGQR
jgi:hypothetical protein